MRKTIPAIDKNLDRRSFLATLGAGVAGCLSSSCSPRENHGTDPLLGPQLLETDPAGAAATRRQPALSSTSDMPMRILGDTGQEVSILAFGGGSRFMVLGEGNWQAALDNAVLGGINLFDTAPSYGDDQESEKRYGRHLSENYRDRILLSTKVESRDPAIAAAEIEQSFENLHTEVIDLLQIHGLEPTDNLDWILGENGLWELMTRLKEEGRVRFIGASVMYSPEVALRFAGQARPDVMLLAINAFSKGFTPYADFEDSALQEIRGLGVGVLTMKAMRDLVGTGSGRLSAGQLLQYNWDLDVSTILVGHERLSELDFNLELAASREIPTALDPEELAWIRRRAQGRKDLPCWLQPGYVDGRA